MPVAKENVQPVLWILEFHFELSCAFLTFFFNIYLNILPCCMFKRFDIIQLSNCICINTSGAAVVANARALVTRLLSKLGKQDGAKIYGVPYVTKLSILPII